MDILANRYQRVCWERLTIEITKNTFDMTDFNINDIREEIKNLLFEEKMAYLDDKESELEEIVEELNGYISDISSLKEEIQTEWNDKRCKQVIQSLKNNGYNLDIDNNGNLSFPLGLANITIIMQFLDTKVKFHFNANQNQLKFRELISSILPEFKADGYFFSLQVSDGDVCKCVVSMVDMLMKHKEEFEIL